MPFYAGLLRARKIYTTVAEDDGGMTAHYVSVILRRLLWALLIRWDSFRCCDSVFALPSLGKRIRAISIGLNPSCMSLSSCISRNFLSCGVLSATIQAR